MSVLCKSTKYAVGKQAGKSFSASVGHADRKALKFTSDSCFCLSSLKSSGQSNQRCKKVVDILDIC